MVVEKGKQQTTAMEERRNEKRTRTPTTTTSLRKRKNQPWTNILLLAVDTSAVTSSALILPSEKETRADFRLMVSYHQSALGERLPLEMRFSQSEVNGSDFDGPWATIIVLRVHAIDQVDFSSGNAHDHSFEDDAVRR